MVEIDPVIFENVKLFLNKLRKAGMDVSEAYIFGSYARGQADKWSDIDVAVVSSQIGDDRFEERIRLTELAVSIDDRLEPLPFSLKSFNNTDPFVQVIKNEGISVVPSQ